MPFTDLALARRLESAEACACSQFAAARRRLRPDSGSEWTSIGGATVTFDGVGSPLTQTFGLGLFDPLTPAILDQIERFYRDRGASVEHEVCPLAGVPALDLLCARGYRPTEITSVMFQPVAGASNRATDGGEIAIHEITSDEAALWSQTSALAWSYDHPELFDVILEMGTVFAARTDSPSFLARFAGEPAATASLSLHQGVALFAGAATLAPYRRRGLQNALLETRMAFAAAAGCDLAMMCAHPGGESERNAERNGFRLAYTRLKWKLHDQAAQDALI